MITADDPHDWSLSDDYWQRATLISLVRQMGVQNWRIYRTSSITEVVMQMKH